MTGADPAADVPPVPDPRAPDPRDRDPFTKVRRALDRPGAPSSDHDLNPDRPAPPALRRAAVLVLLRPGAAGSSVILTKRSPRLRHHPGQIAFPGGKLDAGDADETAAALREAGEEIGLPPQAAAILGLLPAHETVTGFRVTPVLARLTGPFRPVPDPREVAEAFEVPLAHVTDPARFRIEGRLWQGRMRRYYTVPWGPYYIWGATARILRALADRMPPP